MRSVTVAITAGLLVTNIACAVTPRTEDEKTLYALGVALSENIASFELTTVEVAFVQQGLADGATGKKPLVDVQSYLANIQNLQKSRTQAAAEREKRSGAAFLTKAAQQKGAQKLPSGVVVIPLRAGTGPFPEASDQVKVHYHGTLIDGTVFDSSIERQQPATFPLAGVIACWSQGVQTMKVGGKSRIVCPAETAYGSSGAPPKIKPGATIIFDVELLEIMSRKQ